MKARYIYDYLEILYRLRRNQFNVNQYGAETARNKAIIARRCRASLYQLGMPVTKLHQLEMAFVNYNARKKEEEILKNWGNDKRDIISDEAEMDEDGYEIRI